MKEHLAAYTVIVALAVNNLLALLLAKLMCFFFMCTIIRECYLSHSTVGGILEKKRVNSSSIVCLTYIVDGCFGQSPKARRHIVDGCFGQSPKARRHIVDGCFGQSPKARRHKKVRA